MTSITIEFLQSSSKLSNGDSTHLERFVESCLELGTFDCKDNAEKVMKIINANLNSSFDKEKGLILLLAFLQQAPVEAFSNNAVSWMVQCNKIIHQKEINNLGLKVLAKLIKLSIKFPEVSKETAKQIVPKFLLDHVRRKADAQVSMEMLECLQAFMSVYPGPLGEFKTDVLKLLLSTVEARTEVVQAASRCVPLLAAAGGGGKRGTSHKTAWHKQQLSLLSLLHSLLNKIYEHINCLVEVQLVSPGDPLFTVEPVSERDILYKTQQLAIQFVSIAQFLQAMLLEEFPVAKPVAPNAILDMIVHAQKPTHSALGTSREALAVVSVLPSVQVATLRILESLIVCLGRNLVPQGSLVSYMCSQVIVWTQQQHTDRPYAMVKPYKYTRIAAYSCLHSWLSMVGAACPLETLIDKALPVMLADIHTNKPTVKLTIGQRSGKGKKKQQPLINVEERSEKLGDSVANSELCEQALLTLTLLIRTACCTLRPEIIANINDTVLRLVEELPVPYSEANCLSALYKLLLTLCLESHYSVPPPLAPALATFTAGLHHPNPQVKATCELAISCLEKVIHPAAATLYFPLPQEKQKPFAREWSEDSEDSQLEIKRRRVDIAEDSEPILSIMVGNIEDKSSPISSTSDKIIDVISDDSIGILKVLPVTSKSQSPKDELIVTIGSECVEVVPDDKDEAQTKCITESSRIMVEDKFSNKPETAIIALSEITCDSCPNEAGLTKTDDTEVSKMLMDFTDEIDSGTES